MFLGGKSHWLPDPVDQPTLREITPVDLLDEAVARHPDGEALVYSVYDDLGVSLRWTYAEYAERVRAVSAAVIAAGLEPGERALVWTTNLPEFLLLQFALGSTGVVMCPINPLYRHDEFVYVADRASANAVFMVPEDRGESLWELAASAAAEVPTLRLSVAIGEAPDDRGMSWKDFIAAGASVDAAEVDQRRRAIRPEDLSQIQFTSGTTGFPKGVELTNWIFANQGTHIAHRGGFAISDRIVNPLPFFHCGGCIVVGMSTVAVAATHVPIVTFDPARVATAIERERATVAAGVPTMQIAVEEEVARTGQDLTSLHTWVTGGSIVPPELARRWQERYDIDHMITYGMTEFGPVAAVTSPTDPRELQTTTVGRPMPHVELDVVEPGSAVRVPIGEEGEVRYRGFVMLGYHKDPDATAATVRDGWLCSGDLGQIDAEGFVSITGRTKDLIIRGGENIAPASIEQAVMSLDGVLDCAVIGVRDDKYGEAVCAYVRLGDGVEMTLESLREQLTGRIARFKLPSHVRVIDAFPTTPSGKIQKFKLREYFDSET
jgi:acyl-CoA synthetase (AMP-forming)/AMP-acid ligase II